MCVSSLIPGEWENPSWVLVRGGLSVDKGDVGDASTRVVRPDDTVVVVNLPGLIPLGFFILKAVVASYVVNFVMSALFGAPAAGRETRNDTSAVYGWSGISLDYNAAGNAYPLGYGVRPLAGYVVSQYVRVIETADGPKSTLYILQLLGLGEVAAIGDITSDADGLSGTGLPAGSKINGNDAQSYDGVRMWVRLGSLNQEPIPIFEAVPTVYEVGLPISQLANLGTAGEDPVIDFSMGAEFLMPEGSSAQRGTVTIYHPSGLYKFNNDGNVIKEEVRLQVRYTPVDALGVPSGPSVTLPGSGDDAFFSIRQKILSAFETQLDFDFIDPDALPPADPSIAREFVGSTKNYGRIDQVFIDAVGDLDYSVGGEPDAFSVLWYGRVDNSKPYNAIMSWGDWNEDVSDPAVEGIVIFARETEPGQSVIELWFGDSTSDSSRTVVLQTPFPDVEEGVFTQVAVTYKVNAIGGSTRIRVYVDSNLALETIVTVTVAIGPSLGGSGPRINVLPRKEDTLSAWHGDMTHDELRFYTVELTPDEVGVAWSNGAPVTVGDASQPSGAKDDRVLWALDFQAIGGVIGVGPYEFAVIGQVKATVSSSKMLSFPSNLPIDPVEPAIVAQQEITGATIAGRYLIEVQRLDKEKDQDNAKDLVEFRSFTGWVDTTLSHPGCVLVGVEIPATDQLNNGSPQITHVVDQRLVRVWDGVSLPSNPAFTVQPSRYPADGFTDLALDKAEGGGQHYDVDDIDWFEINRWRSWSAEQVYDQKGRASVSQISHAEVGGQVVITARVALPIPEHWIVGSKVKLGFLVPGAFPYPSEGLTVASIVDVGDDVSTDVSVLWGSAGVGPKNIVPDADTFDIGGGTWTSTDGPMVIEELADPENPPPHLPTQPRAARIRVPVDVGDCSLEVDLTGELTVARVYTTVFAFKILDGLGDLDVTTSFDGVEKTQIIADAGAGPSAPWQYVLRNDEYTGADDEVKWLQPEEPGGESRLIALGQVQVVEGEFSLSSLPDFDYLPSASSFSGSNAATSTNDLGDSSEWVPSSTAGDLPTLVSVSSKDYRLPVKVPGRVAVWRFSPNGSTSSFLRQTGVGSANGDDFRVTFYARVVDGRGDAQYVANAGGGVNPGVGFLPDDGAFHLLSFDLTGGVDGDYLEFGFRKGPRDIAVGAIMVVESAEYAPYDEPGRLAYLMGTHPRHALNMTLSERGAGFWDQLKAIASVGRADPVRVGSMLSVVFNKEESPIHHFNPSNVIGSTVSLNQPGRRAQMNSVTGEIDDEDIDYRRNPVPRNHPSLGPGATSLDLLVREVVDLRGVTSRAQAVRELDVLLEQAQRQLDKLTFRSGLYALGVRAGDIFTFGHPMLRDAQGAKVFDATGSTRSFTVDTEIELISRNACQFCGDLTAPPWEVTPDNPPTVTLDAAAEPSEFGGEEVASQIDFPAGDVDATWIEQYFASRGPGEVVTCVIWLRTLTGTADLAVQLFEDGGDSIDVATASLTTAWTRVVRTGTIEAAIDVAGEIGFRLRNSTSSAVSVLASRPFFMDGADDGSDAIGDAFNDGALQRVFCYVERSVDGEQSFVELSIRAGRILAGGRLWTLSPMSFTPSPGDFLVFGATELISRLWRARNVALTPDIEAQISAIQYDPEVYRDPDDFEDADIAGQGSPGDVALVGASANPAPAVPVSVMVIEESYEDPSTGSREKGALVTWSHQPNRAMRVARSIVWVRDVTNDEPWEVAATAEGLRRSVSIRHRFVGGVVYSFRVQPVSAEGRSPGLETLPVTRLTFGGYFPRRDPLSGASVRLQAEMATYAVTVQERLRGHEVQIVRGGAFIGQEVTRLPAGRLAYGPTYDWCATPDNTLNEGQIRVLARLVGPDDDHGELVNVENGIDTAALPDSLASGACEDDWTAAGALTVLEEVARITPPRGLNALHFPDASGDLEGVYEIDEIDLGRVRRVHVSLAADGAQWAPTAVESRPGLTTRRGQFWTLQGPLNPSDPDFGAVSVELEVRLSRTASASSAVWQPYRPGVFVARAMGLRVRVTRPSVSWDVDITRVGFAVRPLSPTLDIDGGDDDP